MQTLILPPTSDNLDRAAQLLRRGSLCAFPTETVYGLGALASDAAAVAGIFAAKNRPPDNPLIIHVADEGQARALWARVPDAAVALMREFWPGPLTLILPRAAGIPDIITAGLDTVAVRCPAHEVALGLIRRAGPIAAPSANPSGRPSPTTARHVHDDLAGRIPMILDGGACAVGVESTVLSLAGDPVILRPGGITRAQIAGFLGCEVGLSPGILSPVTPEDPARSPGMKHRHYAPDARVTLIMGSSAGFAERASREYDESLARGQRPLILCYAGTRALVGGRRHMCYGADPAEASASLYALLREADRQGYDRVFAQGGGEEPAWADGAELPVVNRLLRAADFDVIRADVQADREAIS